MMKSATRLLLLAASVRFAIASASGLWNDLTSDNLDSTVEENNHVLAVFSSRTFEPVQSFHGIIEKLDSDQRINTKIILIDCEAEAQLCRKHDVNEYPAIRLFKKSSLKEDGSEEIISRRYRGRKTEHAIRSFVTKHEYDTVSEVEDEDRLSVFKEVDDVVIVAFLPRHVDEPKRAFLAIAEKYHGDFVFGFTYNEKSAENEGVTIPSIVCYKNTDGDHKALDGNFNEADVENFLATAPKMVIGDFSERTLEAYMATNKLSAYLFATTNSEARALRHELTPIAHKFEPYVIFGVADALEYRPMAKNFGLGDDKFPALAIHAPLNDNVFVYLQGRKITATVVDAMLTTILQGQAVSGQIFGGEAPEILKKDAESETRQRDEL